MGSLRARLTLALIMPMFALALALGLIVQEKIAARSDRLLLSSVQTIGQALEATPGSPPSVHPRSAGVWPGRTPLAPMFSVHAGNRLVAGSPDLPPPEALAPPTGRQRQPASFGDPPQARTAAARSDEQTVLPVIRPAYLRATMIRGRPARVATEIRQLRGSSQAVSIQAADFLDERRAYEKSLFVPALAAIALAGTVTAPLLYGAMGWSVRPFMALAGQIDAARAGGPETKPLTLAPGAPAEAIGVVNAVNSLILRAERASEAMHQFTASAAHQLRTPLAIVQVHVDVLRRHGSQSPQGTAALADIAQAVASLERLLVQLLALARMEDEPRESVPLAPFDLASLAATILAARLAHPDAARIDFAFEGAPPSLPALGDEIFAGEMIANLLDNAIRYNRPGGSVIVKVAERDGLPVLEIEDDGPGIAPDLRKKVWDRFYRGPGADASPGSGLGLSIVRALGERIGAQVDLEEGREGQGVKAVILFAPAPVEPSKGHA